MTFKQAVKEYDISLTSIQKWKKRLHSMKTCNIEPTKIANDALLNNVENHPDSYHYERARRLGCNTSGICVALE